MRLIGAFAMCLAVANGLKRVAVNVDIPAVFSRHGSLQREQLGDKIFSNSSKSASGFVIESTLDDHDLDVYYTRYKQTHKELPIYPEGTVAVSALGNGVIRAHGAVLEDLDVDIETSLDASEALELVRDSVTTDEPRVFTNQESTKIIYVNGDVKPRVAFLVSFFSETIVDDIRGNPTRPVVVIDGKTGLVLEEFDALTTDIKDSYDEGYGPGGNEKAGLWYYGESRDTDVNFPPLQVQTDSRGNSVMETVDVKTTDMDGSTRGDDEAFEFEGDTNTHKEINGAYAPLNDAHKFAQTIVEAYEEYVGEAPLKFQLIMRVHYGVNYENAFWDGKAMTFGDGANTFYPLVCQDVAGHEVSHGFTEQHSNLRYSGQSGGINEAYSDIAGETIEHFLRIQDGLLEDWLVGEEIYKQADGGRGLALRYFEDPTLDGKSIDNAADYYDRLDVHYSSGVYNKAFYLLAHSEGYDIVSAFQLFARANQVYWTPTTDFDSGAQGVYDAAVDFGTNTASVVNAFAEVGVYINGYHAAWTARVQKLGL